MKNINPIYLFMLLGLSLLTSCIGDELCLDGNRDIRSEVREHGTFIGVCKMNSIDVQVYYAPVFEVIVTADRNILPSIETYINNDILHVELDEGCFRDFDAHVEIYMPDLAILDSRGSGDMLVEGFEDLPDLRLDLRGSGDITLFGSAEDFFIDKSGSGDIRAFGMNVLSVFLDKSGSGDLEVRAEDLITGEMGGSGDLIYRGFPAISLDKSGSGDIINAN